MKRGSIFHVSVFLFAVLVFSMPFVSLAQRSVTGMSSRAQAQAISDAERDAEASVNKSVWFLAGCFGNILGFLTAQTYDRPVPTVPLLGKSPEYVAFYTDAYRKKTKQIQVSSVVPGCVGSCILYAIPFIAAMIQIEESGRW